MQTPFSDLDNAVLLSALEHYGYCPRQCALIHREQTYDENIFTLRAMRYTNGWTSRERQQVTGYGRSTAYLSGRYRWE